MIHECTAGEQRIYMTIPPYPLSLITAELTAERVPSNIDTETDGHFDSSNYRRPWAAAAAAEAN